MGIMKRFQLANILLILLLVSNLALASNHSYYLSAQAGLGGMQTPKLANADTFVLGTFAWRYSGGYLYKVDVMQYGFEIGHDGFQSNSYGKSPIVTRFRGYSDDLLAVIRYDFQPTWNIFTEFGPARFCMTTESTATTPNVQHTTKILPELAFGFGYGLTEALSLNISFDYLFGTKPKLNENTYEVTQNTIPMSSEILAGFTYTF